MNAINQNNTYRAYVMVVRFIKNIDEVYQASSIDENNPDWNLSIITRRTVSLDTKLSNIS